MHARAGNSHVAWPANVARARSSSCSFFYCLTKVETARRLLWLHHSNMNQKLRTVLFPFVGMFCGVFNQRQWDKESSLEKLSGAALSPHFCEYPCVLVWQLLATMEQIFCCFPCFQVWGKQALPGQLQELLTDRCEKPWCFEITRFQLQKTIFISNNKNRNWIHLHSLAWFIFLSFPLCSQRVVIVWVKGNRRDWDCCKVVEKSRLELGLTKG